MRLTVEIPAPFGTKKGSNDWVSREAEYPLFHKILHTVSEAQTPVWLLVPVLIVAKDRGMHGEHWQQKTKLFQVGKA